jgi:hypothetical protein
MIGFRIQDEINYSFETSVDFIALVYPFLWIFAQIEANIEWMILLSLPPLIDILFLELLVLELEPRKSMIKFNIWLELITWIIHIRYVYNIT